jgi:RNA polymerase sigma factor (sigma-70 family)
VAESEPRNGAGSRKAPAAGPRDPVEDTTHEGLMVALRDERRMAALLAKVTYMARTRYGIRAQDAQDIFHESVVTYLQIHGRYPPGDNHFGLLVGVFQRKALEFLGASQRKDRVAERLLARLRADRPDLARGEDPSGNVADCVIREEDARLIRAAIDALSPESRELVLALAEGRATRLEMIESLGMNRNTFDTRLRTVRLRLKKALETLGVL